MEKLNKKKLVVKKGYTLTVDSWENDADNSQTHSTTVVTLKKATALYNLMQLCVSKNNLPKGVIRLGNTLESFSFKQIELIEDFLKANPILGKIEARNEEDDDDWDDYIRDRFHTITAGLLGSSEDFICRVMEDCVVTYSDKDIYLDIIKIKN